MSMLKLLVRRLLLAIPILLAVLVLTFLFLRLAGGDPADVILGVGGTAEQRQRIREELGLDNPIWVQFGNYFVDLLQGDLGNSITKMNQPVTKMILARLPVSLAVITVSVVVSLVIGVTLGTIAAIKGGKLDKTLQTTGVLGFSLPNFWLALIMIVIFAVGLGWFPTGRYVPFSTDPVKWLHHLVLPVFAISLSSIGSISLQTRAAMLENLNKEYVRVLRAAGVRQRSVIFKHVLRGAAPTIISVAGLQFIGKLGGVLYIEQVFAIAGTGRLASEAALEYDFPTLQGLVLCFALLVVIINLLVDLGVAAAAPKVRLT